MRNNLEGVNIRNCIAYNLRTFTGLMQLGGTLTMTGDEPNVFSIDCNGAARTVLLPPEANGLQYTFINVSAGAFAITLKDDSNTTTVGTVAQGEMKRVVCRPGANGALGWSISA